MYFVLAGSTGCWLPSTTTARARMVLIQRRMNAAARIAAILISQGLRSFMLSAHARWDESPAWTFIVTAGKQQRQNEVPNAGECGLPPADIGGARRKG